jgi:hypothetical protein
MQKLIAKLIWLHELIFFPISTNHIPSVAAKAHCQVATDEASAAANAYLLLGIRHSRVVKIEKGTKSCFLETDQA